MTRKFRVLTVFVLIWLANPAAGQSAPAEIPSAAFASLQAHVGASLSPEGERIAYLYPLNDRWHLVIHEFATGENTVIPPLDDKDFDWLHWATPQYLVVSIAYSSVRYSTDTRETRLLSIDVESGNVAWLIKPANRKAIGSLIATEPYPPPQLQDNVVDWLLDDDQHILVALDEDFNGAEEIRKVELASGDYDVVHRSPTGIQTWLLDHSGDFRFGYGYDNSRFNTILKVTEDEWVSPADTAWYQDGWEPIGFTPDPSIIYVSGYGEHGTLELRTLDINTGRFVETLYSDARYDLGAILHHPVTGRAAGFRYTKHRDRFEYVDPELDRLQKSIDKVMPATSNRITSTTHDLRKILVTASSDTEPGTVYLWDRDAKSIEPFGWLMEELDPDLMSAATPIEYESFDGTLIPGYLMLPQGAEPTALPTVILPHGGPAARIEQSFWFLPQFLASRGYAVLQPNFRGSSGYGQDFEDAGSKQWGGIMQDDVDAAAEWLVAQGIADKDRVCILGWSYGAYSAAMGLIKSPELYRCGIGINGVYNLPRLIAEDKNYIGGRVWIRHIGLDGESARAVSPAHLADKVQAPMLLIHAEDDSRAPIYHAEGFHKELQRNDKDAKLVSFPLGGHGMENSAARRLALDEIEVFLATHLAP